MKERPILFSGPMVRALLEGRKTQTRRIIKPGKWLDLAKSVVEVNGKWVWCTVEYDLTTPYGEPGDRLWVRETWTADCKWPVDGGVEDLWWHDVPKAFRGAKAAGYIYYAADGGRAPYQVADDGLDSAQPAGWEPTEEDLEGIRWRPSIYMPRWASRLTLELNGVRVERVQDISEADAKDEGLVTLTKDGGRTWKYGIADRDGLPGTDNDGWEWRDWSVDPRAAYRRLWESINGPDSWTENPWVWVLEFKAVAP